MVVVDVEAGQLHQRDPLVEFGVGLAAKDLDVVAEIDQRLGQVAHVDALAAAVGLSAIRKDRDAEGFFGVHKANPTVEQVLIRFLLLSLIHI